MVAVPLVTMQLLSTVVPVTVETLQGERTRKRFMQNIRSSHSVTTNNTNGRKDKEPHNGTICPASPHLSSCLRAASIQLQRFALFLHHGDYKGGENTTCVFLLLYKSHVTLCDATVGVSARLINKQSVQTQRGNSHDSSSYSISLQLQEHCVPALIQPDNKDGLHAQIFS